MNRQAKKNVYTFGPIIHNEEVVKDLEKKGVFVINTMEELDDITEGTVIIRSHGVSSAVYEALQKKGVEIVDATCPFVLKIHNIVKQESANGKQIVIIGNEKHPEVERKLWGGPKTQVHVVDTAEKATKSAIRPTAGKCVSYPRRHLITINLKN